MPDLFLPEKKTFTFRKALSNLSLFLFPVLPPRGPVAVPGPVLRGDGQGRPPLRDPADLRGRAAQGGGGKGEAGHAEGGGPGEEASVSARLSIFSFGFAL